ncbi:DNA/RNA helicase domain-containing protein [Streptomyces sp. NPDC058373]|uniref:DNA/RNA helicase domain-containing protein n=1 Tax=Streptomyces sp. NPDC058373 TaxID=3346465 RepID=UPI00364EB250
MTGGAGTGKSAIGLQIKAELEAQGRTVMYASGSRAFNGALQEHVGYGDRQFKETFTYFSSFVTPPDPPLDVLIRDEAHRLRDRSTSRLWKQKDWGTGPQVDELLAASRLTVFFLDEGQSVRPHDVGTVDLIKDAAARHDAMVVPYKLRERFRCGGSDAYVRWVRALLGVADGEPGAWRPDGLVHIEVADTPEELEQIIRTQALAGASARMVAGYCWPWTKPLGKERRHGDGTRGARIALGDGRKLDGGELDVGEQGHVPSPAETTARGSGPAESLGGGFSLQPAPATGPLEFPVQPPAPRPSEEHAP